MVIKNVDINLLIPYSKNAKKHPKEQVKSVTNSIREFGMVQPIVCDKNHEVVIGHCRLLACKKLKYSKVPVLYVEDLTIDQVNALRLADNKTNESEWDLELLDLSLDEIEMDMEQFGFEPMQEEEEKIIEDEAPWVDEKNEPIAKMGDIWQLGRHRLMCGDSTDPETVAKLMDGVKADMVFTDPPYGMKKEGEGVENDNLNLDDLLEFNKKWIKITFDSLKDVGSWYCWGIDEPLMDIYSHIIKPMIRNQQATFRNLITWNKGSVRGQMSEEFRMYPIADEKCLFVMKGVQGLNNNSDNYFESWEPIRLYLLNSRLEMGWDVPTMKKIVGHSDLSRDHWTSTSQFTLIPEYCYNALQNAVAEREKNEQKEYSAFKKEYDEIKKEYYSTRAYFNNTHDNQNNVWSFERTGTKERKSTGGHATPKPIALCERGIKSSSRNGEIVLDLFGGSGSTLIACEQLDRTCYMMEFLPKWVDVIIKRWEILTGEKAVLLNIEEE